MQQIVEQHGHSWKIARAEGKKGLVVDPEKEFKSSMVSYLININYLITNIFNPYISLSISTHRWPVLAVSDQF